MCDWITTMKVVDGNGALRTLPGTASDLPGGTTVTIDEIRKAAQVSLGVFGVVVEFTLKVQPMSNRRVQNTFDYTLGVRELLKQLFSQILLSNLVGTENCT